MVELLGEKQKVLRFKNITIPSTTQYHPLDLINMADWVSGSFPVGLLAGSSSDCIEEERQV